MPQPIIGYALPLTTPAEQTAQNPAPRLERHNVSVDENLADQGVCAQVHLPTGRICLLPHRHRGSCHFEPPTDRHASNIAIRRPHTAVARAVDQSAGGLTL
jgi:hypothetical protein